MKKLTQLTKKLLLVLGMITCMFGMTACGAAVEEVDNYGLYQDGFINFLKLQTDTHYNINHIIELSQQLNHRIYLNSTSLFQVRHLHQDLHYYIQALGTQ